MSRRLALATALAALLGCATGGKLVRTAEAVQGDLEKARKGGALRCAPRELALAEANLDFGRVEIDAGNASRAGAHLRQAEQSVKKALELSRACGPAQVTIREPKAPAAPAVVIIDKVDTDRDGVADLDDRCPEVPGLPALGGCPDGDGDGLLDAEDACPAQPGPREAQGCPVAKDSDGDLLQDDIDRCPLDPEDGDGFQDEDGCPDPDNDGDGIVDKIDACPATPGPIESRGCPVLDRDKDGVLDDADRCPDEVGVAPDGCPKKYSLVEVKKDRISIKQQVHFASAKWKVLPTSFPLLDQVAQVLRDYPGMRVSVEGHTDTVGAEGLNVKLSQARAEAVRDYLVKKGADPARLEAIGFGPARPIASNKTAPGRAKNRRTEFRIISME
ncbi:MAG: OmpA family protein [Anaeromyxobacter sp.]|nr:OmpA family protein [Anaeromyxobacter sp.]MBL0276602.1 OmpA family protein [Anaeromyxobacter sp.]